MPQKQKNPLIGENILFISAALHKGCVNDKEEGIEIWTADGEYLVCVDNIVTHVVSDRRDALAYYGEYFG
ncbi:MAG TPA: hypothetical protein VHV10_05005 [Ktedonobacteraceae bacterium]|jgi:hypothetical protein|nr:hypothetical protein [Ktedonobacteraceae bacterium]